MRSEATPAQIRKLETAFRKMGQAQQLADEARNNFASVFEKLTGISGMVDYHPGDGFGFATADKDDCHVTIPWLIQKLKAGEKLTSKIIDDNTSF